MVLVPAAEAVAAAAITPFKALALTVAAKFTTAVLAVAAVAALVAAATLALAALAAAATAAATVPAFAGASEPALVFLLLELLEDSEVEADDVALEELLVPPELEPVEEVVGVEVLLGLLLLLPVDEPLVVEVDEEPDPEVVPLELTEPESTTPLASMVTPPVLPPVDVTEPLTLIACAVAVI